MSRKRHSADIIEQGNSIPDDKNLKAMWDAQGGEPLSMLPRFKMLRLRFLILCTIWSIGAIIAMFIVFRNAPPQRIMATTLFLGGLGLGSVVPIFNTLMNYKSDDYAIFWISLVSYNATMIIGFSADFILEYVILPRALYGKSE
ncbi:MAG: hypothetical protein CMP20_15875 [Rickettsiales bacterium]|nr:hypothetical protein [Rickettsiales bacterium]